MKVPSYTIHDDVCAEDPLWKTFRQLVDSEGWKSDDHSFMDLIPVMKSTKSIFAKNSENEFVCCIVWHENEEQAIISVYLTAEKYRGQGIGKVLWNRAFERIPKGFTVGLRSVPKMVDWYKNAGLSVEGPYVDSFAVPVKLTGIFKQYEIEDSCFKLITEMDDEDLQIFYKFDQSITSRDRSEFLQKFHDLPYTSGSCLFDQNGEIKAYAAICPTSIDSMNLYKVAPIWASSLSDAFTVIRPLIDFAEAKSPEALLLLNIFSDTKGQQELRSIVDSAAVVKRPKAAITLYSKDVSIPMKKDMIFIGNGNYAHFDT